MKSGHCHFLKAAPGKSNVLSRVKRHQSVLECEATRLRLIFHCLLFRFFKEKGEILHGCKAGMRNKKGEDSQFLFLLRTIFQTGWAAAGRACRRPCCRSRRSPGSGGKRKGPAVAGGSAHAPAAPRGTRLLSASCPKAEMLRQTIKKHILEADLFRAMTPRALRHL